MRKSICPFLHDLIGYSPLSSRGTIINLCKVIVFIAFTLTICWILIIFYLDSRYLVGTELISVEYFQTYYRLNLSNPTILGIYLSSYSHRLTDISHICNNLMGYLISSVFIVVIWFVRERTKTPIPKGYFLSLLGILYLLGPFVISGCSMICGFIPSSPVVIAGFSGIVAALWGVLFVLLYPITYNVAEWMRGQTYENEKFKKLFVSLIRNIPLICVITLIISYIFDWWTALGSSMQHNMFGHIGGLLFGAIAAYILEWYLSGRKPGET